MQEQTMQPQQQCQSNPVLDLISEVGKDSFLLNLQRTIDGLVQSQEEWKSETFQDDYFVMRQFYEAVRKWGEGK